MVCWIMGMTQNGGDIGDHNDDQQVMDIVYEVSNPYRKEYSVHKCQCEYTVYSTCYHVEVISVTSAVIYFGS